LKPATLKGIEQAVDILEDAVLSSRYMTVCGDYDCDGATGTAILVKGLRLMYGKDADRVRYALPDREKHGYGLSVGLVDSLPAPTDVIVTVDSGISSFDGVAYAKSLGYTVVITDHHLQGVGLPIADAIVNPNQQGCAFPSKSMAGCGVAFYVLLALRERLRAIGHFAAAIPLFQVLGAYVAIGTVADLVPLDHNNRILVRYGLQLIQHQTGYPGIQVLLEVSNKRPEYFTSTDIAFAIAPRLNAAGRLADMTLGVRLLLSEDPEEAKQLATELNAINDRRREIQAEMVYNAESLVDVMPVSTRKGVVVYQTSWHHGVVGLVASKLKESLHRPIVAFAPADESAVEVRGSCRSIPGFHLRDALALIDARHPGLILKFGGHAMAAGLSLRTVDIPVFQVAFESVCDELITPDLLEQIIYSDGELDPNEMTIDYAQYLERCGPWGQGFPKPVFDGIFEVSTFKVLAERHFKLELHDTREGSIYDAIWFFGYEGQDPPKRFRMAYELSLNVYRDKESLQLLVRHVESLD
jgi:single-stranded-DNA-specific exonuclease